MQMDEVRLFESAILSAFDFLERDFRFERRKTSVAGAEMAVPYANRTTVVTVHAEQGVCPWVELGALRPGTQRDEVLESYALDFVRVLRNVADPEPKEPAGWTPDRIVQRIIGEAASLRADAADILQGDFSSFPQIRELANQEATRRSRELFGTEE